MPRAIQISEQLLNSHYEDLQKRKAFETGLVVALQGAKADTVLRFIRTPEAEEGQEAKTIVTDWVLEHANQVARMLPGGVVVLERVAVRVPVLDLR